MLSTAPSNRTDPFVDQVARLASYSMPIGRVLVHRHEERQGFVFNRGEANRVRTSRWRQIRLSGHVPTRC